jgi:[ribosomal protein S5]-alanine N-acetyltransferase
LFDKKIVINTEHLILRPFCESDSEAMFKIQCNTEMTKYTPDEPWKSIEEGYEFIKLAQRLYEQEYSAFRHFFAVIDRESQNLIGYCGVGGIDYDHSENEVFYAIEKSFWGKGYATECGKAMLEYGFVQLGLPKIIGAVDKENLASIRVLEKIGLKRVGFINGLPEEFSFFNGECLYVLRRDEYIKDEL